MLVNLSVLCSKKISCLDKIIVFLLLLYDFKLYISLFYILKPRNNGRRSKLCSLRLGFHPTKKQKLYEVWKLHEEIFQMLLTKQSIIALAV